MTDTKIVFEEKIVCPYCSKSINVVKKKSLVNEPVKPEYDEEVIVSKDTQTTLNSDDFGTN